MKYWRLLATLLLLLPISLFTACEGDDESTEEPVATEEQTSDTQTADTEDDSDTETDPYFPDGLHPNGGGDSIIAGVFAGHISGEAGSTVVCLGDSITEGGYPGAMAGLTGMNVVDAGVGGEQSYQGLSRVNSVLEQYSPTYLCILFGANDVIQGVDAATTVANLNAIVQAAKDNGAIPIVGTLTPMSGDKYGHLADEVRDTSSAIRGGVNASIADLEDAF